MEWRKKPISSDSVKALAERYGCDLLTASILLRRGITSGEEIRYYLENDLRYLRNPFELPGMEDAVERILAAKEEGEKILVFGDRDVDGITGTVLLADFLNRSGMDVRWRLPMGDDPYGLSMEAVEEFAADYGTLIITVDCGISNRAEIARAAELGVGTVITDHHNPPRQLPDAQAIVNPKLAGSPYPFRDLCGCAVAYKLVSALRFALKSEVYGQPICLLNTRPSNDAVIVEAAKLRNLAVIDTLTETVVPGMVAVTDTRLPAFLSGQQILCWDLPVQQKLLVRTFGGGAEIQMLDIAGEIGRQIPQTAGKSLFRLKEVSRIGRYREEGIGELDVLVNLFISFVQKKESFFDDEDGSDLQLAALGTIADIMPLRDENRLMVRKGVEAIVKKPRPGLSELLFVQDLAGRPLGTEEISWQLTPVINASGRMGRPEKAAALLLGGTAEERNRLAGEVSVLNEERKKLGDKIWESAEPQARKNLERFYGNLALAWGEGIIRGITGIIANRLSRCFNIPAVVVSLGPDKATGSLRSARNYDLSFLLDQCSDLFIDWGGHDFAAGFSMDRSNWEPFLDRLAGIASHMELGPETGAVLELDAELPLSYLSLLEDDPRIKDKKDLYILRLADRFEPYGEKNRPLLFLSRGLGIADIQIMGSEGKHVKLTMDTGKFKWPAVYWNAADRINVDFRIGDTVDMVYTVNRNWFNGMETPQLIVQDIGKSGQNTG
ncbi:MAG: single-stranded-DNA-specific exonuclease RecJ [Spirochaetaceae bacterium]|jgi:single-stranded-DNA-specific exonuclease|nr:single-stranded-DNA-specific exonuclease RecJ [Spirochaetaceae bacterium]